MKELVLIGKKVDKIINKENFKVEKFCELKLGIVIGSLVNDIVSKEFE